MAQHIPAVSVIMPVYNAQEYVRQAVESVLKQTFLDFELLMVNDGSTDGSLAILEQLAGRDSRIRLISRPNTGYVVALNEMLSLVRAPLLARMDADDICLPHRLAVQKAYMDAHPEVVLLGARVELMDERSRDIFTIYEATGDEATQRQLLAGNNVVCHPVAMMRTQAVRAAGGYRPRYMPAEDLDLWLRLGEGGQIHVLGEVLLRYREHEGSVSSRAHDRQLQSIRQVCEEAWKRRGITGEFTNRGWRSTRPREVCERMIKYGWTAFNRANRLLAIEFAFKALWAQPHRLDAWRLLACSVVKRMRTLSSGGAGAS